MGIKIINPYLQSKNNKGLKKTKLTKYMFKTVIVDVSNFLFRYLYSQGDKYLIGFLMIFDILVSNNIYPIFCFDGLPPIEKSKTLRKRQTQIRERQKKNVDVSQALQLIDEILTEKYQQFHDHTSDQKQINENLYPKKEYESFFYELLLNGSKPDSKLITIPEITRIKEKLEEEKKKNQQKCTRITKKTIENLKKMFDIMDIKYIHSKDQIEADLLCAEMVKQGLVEVMITDDLDPLALGCPRTLRDFSYDAKKEATEYNLTEIIEDMGLSSYNEFLDICLICGTDYTTKIIQIKSVDDLENIIKDLKKKSDWEDKIPKLIRENYLTKYEKEFSEKTPEETENIVTRCVNEYLDKKKFFKQSIPIKDMIKHHNLNSHQSVINDTNYLQLSSYIREKCQGYRPALLAQVLQRINKSYTNQYHNKFINIINNTLISHCPENTTPEPNNQDRELNEEDEEEEEDDEIISEDGDEEETSEEEEEISEEEEETIENRLE